MQNAKWVKICFDGNTTDRDKSVDDEQEAGWGVTWVIWNRGPMYHNNYLDDIIEICAPVVATKEETGDGQEWQQGWAERTPKLRL